MVIVAIIGIALVGPLTTKPEAPVVDGNGVAAGDCQPAESRAQEAADLQAGGAAIVFQKFGGPGCVDQLFGVYPDGRVVGSDGTQQLEAQVTPEAVTALVTNLEGLGWFTDDMYTTWHHPCGECFTYSISITSGDQTKTVGAVDGGTDAPAKYWLATSRIAAILPKSRERPVMRRSGARSLGTRVIAVGCALAVAGCGYVVIPEAAATPTPAIAAGEWSAMATAVQAVDGGLQVDVALRNDTGAWSAFEIADTGAVTLVDASGGRTPCGTAFVGTGGQSLAPGLIIRGYTAGTKSKPVTQLLSVTCEGAALAAGSGLEIAYSYTTGDFNYYRPVPPRTATLRVDLDALAQPTYPGTPGGGSRGRQGGRAHRGHQRQHPDAHGRRAHRRGLRVHVAHRESHQVPGLRPHRHPTRRRFRRRHLRSLSEPASRGHAHHARQRVRRLDDQRRRPGRRPRPVRHAGGRDRAAEELPKPCHRSLVDGHDARQPWPIDRRADDGPIGRRDARQPRPIDRRADDGPIGRVTPGSPGPSTVVPTTAPSGSADRPEWFGLEMTDVRTGQPFTINDFAGKVVLLETMAIWCPTCRRQADEVVRLHELLGHPADLVSISLDTAMSEDAAMLKDYAEKLGYDWNIAVAPLLVARALGNLYSAEYLNPPVSPMLVIDREGNVIGLPYGRQERREACREWSRRCSAPERVETAATAFWIGLLAATSPCVLPLYPGYLAYLSAQPRTNHAGSVRRLLGPAVLAGVLTMMLAIGAIVTTLSIAVGRALTLLVPISLSVILVMGLAMLAGRNPFQRLPGIRVPRHAAAAPRRLYVRPALRTDRTALLRAAGGGHLRVVHHGGRGAPVAVGLRLVRDWPWRATPVALIRAELAPAQRDRATARHGRAIELIGGLLLIGVAVYYAVENWDLFRLYLR